MAHQPMGLGTNPPPAQLEESQKKTELQEQQAALDTAKFLQLLEQDPFLSLLWGEMQGTMLRIYLEHPDGKAQMKLVQALRRKIDPADVARILATRQLVGLTPAK